MALDFELVKVGNIEISGDATDAECPDFCVLGGLLN